MRLSITRFQLSHVPFQRYDERFSSPDIVVLSHSLGDRLRFRRTACETRCCVCIFADQSFHASHCVFVRRLKLIAHCVGSCNVFLQAGSKLCFIVNVTFIIILFVIFNNRGSGSFAICSKHLLFPLQLCNLSLNALHQRIGHHHGIYGVFTVAVAAGAMLVHLQLGRRRRLCIFSSVCVAAVVQGRWEPCCIVKQYTHQIFVVKSQMNQPSSLLFLVVVVVVIITAWLFPTVDDDDAECQIPRAILHLPRSFPVQTRLEDSLNLGQMFRKFSRVVKFLLTRIERLLDACELIDEGRQRRSSTWTTMTTTYLHDGKHSKPMKKNTALK